MDGVFPFILVLAVAGAGIAMTWHFGRGRSLLEEWARSNEFEILSASYCWFWRGPFFLRSGERNAVYRVVVRDGSGRTRSGYVRCGSFLLGMLVGQTTVEWDD